MRAGGAEDSGLRSGRSGGGSPSAIRKSSRSRGDSATSSSSPASFFIVHEPVISPSGDHEQRLSSPSATSKSKRKKKGRSSPLSRDDRPRQRSVTPSDGSGALHTHKEGEFEDDGRAESRPGSPSERHAREKRAAPLTILSRVGSAPDLPLHSSVSSAVYSSSKKRNLLRTVGASGAGPHAVALQRSRLIPLPINIRTGTLTKDARSTSCDNNNSNKRTALRESRSAAELSSQQQQQQVEQERLDADYAIAALKQRLALMEKEAARDLKQRQALEKQAAQLARANQRLSAEKLELQGKLEHLEKDVLLQKHSFERLSDRYAAVYSSLQKLTEQQQSASPDSHSGAVQSVLQALTRENQEFQRKLRVLEERHVEDKTLAGKQEKKFKRLRAEMEALHHMSEANARDDAASDVLSEYAHKTSTEFKASHAALAGSNSRHSVARPSPSTASPNGSAASNGSPSHLIGAEEYQYIDPSILKVLEKVDSQFSITNAINLSVVLKKWLHSCLRVVGSAHIPSVLKLLLSRTCELLHCDHAALFEVNHTQRKLVGRFAESGDVHWELPLDKGILGFAARQNVLCNVPRAYDDPRFYSSTDTITGIPSREVLCVPIVHELLPGQPHSVFAVLQAWNTKHQKPFTPNDQILAGLLTIQAGTVFLQTKVTRTLQKINAKLVRIMRMQHEIVPAYPITTTDASVPPAREDQTVRASNPHASTAAPVSLLQLVANAQKQFSECIGIKKLRIFVLEADVMRIWHVGSELDASTGQAVLVRKYSNVLSSLCGVVLQPVSGSCVIREDPTSEATFNDIVDLNGGAGGMYLAPITSPWGETSLGMIQVARSAVNALSSASSGDDPGFVAAVAKERQAAQVAEDSLTMELIETFARVFAGLLHHVTAQQLYDTCPQEVRDARLAYIADRLECLESEYREEEAQNEAKEEQIARTLAATAMMEQRFLESAHRDRVRATRDDDEKDAVRRVSCTEEVLHPRTRLHTRDTRRISSAGSTRKGIRTAAPDVRYSFGAEEADVESQHDADEASQSDGDEGADHDAGEAEDELRGADADEPDTDSGEEPTGVESEGVEDAAEYPDTDAPGADEPPVVDVWGHGQERDTEYAEDDSGGGEGELGEQERFGELDAPGWQADEGGGGSWRDESELEEPVGLISTDSMYAIDLSYDDSSPAELTGDRSESFSPDDEQPGSY